MSNRTHKAAAREGERPTLSLPPRFTIEVAKVHKKEAADEAAFVEVFEIMLELHKEGGYAPLDMDDAIAAVDAVRRERMTFLARLDAPHGDDPAGFPIGILAMMELPFWYNRRTTYLTDQGFYVRPAYRRGKVGVALLMAARRLAEFRGKIAIVQVTNPDRRPKRNAATVLTQNAGFVPVGYALRLAGRLEAGGAARE